MIHPAKALLVTVWADTIQVQLKYHAPAGFSQQSVQRITSFLLPNVWPGEKLVVFSHLAIFCSLTSFSQLAV
jgi:hypothetical protein